MSEGESEQSATAEEIREWDEENDEPHPVFRVPHRPERIRLEFDDECNSDTDGEQTQDYSHSGGGDGGGG